MIYIRDKTEVPISPIPNMSLRQAKKVLNCAETYHCTIDMLYLDDTKVVLTSINGSEGYDGTISSCIDITTKLCEKYPPTKVAKRLHNRYAMEMPHVHRCIAIYLGKLGKMDDDYISEYPEAGLSNLGTTLTIYNSAVDDTMVLAKLVRGVKKLPRHILDSFSIVYHFDDVLDLDETFNEIVSRVDIVLRYDSSCGTFSSHNGNTETIRRKISTAIGKGIPKRYVEFAPKAMDKSGVMMAMWNGRDLKIYRDKFIFDCRGDDLENVGTYVADIASIIGIGEERMTFAYQSNTKASLEVEMDIWSAIVLEDLIVNDKDVIRIVRVANGLLDLDNIPEDVLQKNRSLVIYVSYPPTRCVFRHTNGFLKISIASHSIDDMAIVVSVAIVHRLLQKYRKGFDATYHKYALNTKKVVAKVSKRSSRIDELRGRLPELFANNYTRECHILPVMLDTEKEAEAYRKMGHLVIKYPLDGPYSRWYTSTSNDLFVGLKLNRLSNKGLFKHIITCYASNHYEIPSRETYAYYRGKEWGRGRPSATLRTLRILSTGRKGPLPIAMTMEHNLRGYSRIGTGGPFVNCVAYALDANPANFFKLVRKGLKGGLLNVIRQEVWDRGDEQLLNDIRKVDELDGRHYRLLEEVYQCNILLVEVESRGKYSIVIPQCKGGYLWEPRDGRYMVVMKNEKKLYEDCLVAYELVVNEYGKGIFDAKDPLVSAILSFKMAHTIRSDVDASEVVTQHITEHGKCNLVVTKKGLMKCNSRPFYRPTIDIGTVRQCSRIFAHTTNNGTSWLTSTRDFLYFPDDVSFRDWWHMA